jgi:hypothetical protein
MTINWGAIILVAATTLAAAISIVGCSQWGWSPSRRISGTAARGVLLS